MKLIKTLISSVFVLCLLASCGGEEKKEEKKTIKIKEKTEQKAEKDDNVANLVITANDLMQYNKTELRVKAGQKVKLTLRHIGKLDKNVMGHNVVILKQGVDPNVFAPKAATARDNDYIPEGTDEVLVHTKMIGGGETAVIEFDAPAVGEYDFLCSFPAHFAMMKGKFIVE